MRRVLVTGATTPLGKELVEALLGAASVERVVAVGRPGESSPVTISDPRHDFHEIDLTRSRALRNLVYGIALDVDAVIHSAAHRSTRSVGRQAHRLNVETTRELLRLCESHPHLERFVYVSSGAIYRIDGRLPDIIDEQQALNLSARSPQWIRDRVEADLTVCTRMGLSSLKVLVLRLSECLAPDMGSQLYDYLNAPLCFRPIGFDPIVNVLSVGDAVEALLGALRTDAQGVFNIPGRDTLALSRLIALWGRRSIAAPSALMAPLYRLRAAVLGSEFRYDMNAWRFRYNGVLDGTRAARELGYQPRLSLPWPATSDAQGVLSIPSASAASRMISSSAAS